jgi:hypothetical protein
MTRKKTIVFILCLIIAAMLLAYLVFTTMTSIPTTLYLDPQTPKSAVGQDFSINISISSVVDLYGWQLQLSWNKTILDVLNVTEGPFLKSGGNSPFFYYNLNATAGQMTVECTRLGSVPGESGSGVLATIRFNVTSSGECDLHLYGAMLLNSSTPPKPIATTVKSGKFSST